MKWNVNHIICKLSEISCTSVSAAAILMLIPQINLSRRVHHDQCRSTSLKLSGGANIGRTNAMFCGAVVSSVFCNSNPWW